MAPYDAPQATSPRAAVRLAACLAGLLLSAAPLDAQVLEGQLDLPEQAYADRSPAIVYLEFDTPQRNPNAPDAVVDQRGQEFIPRVQAVQWGGDVVLRNSDAELHNVNSRKSPLSFNTAIGPQGQQRLAGEAVRRPGILPLLCDIHQHMRGYVVIVGSPYFCQADAQGNFRLEGVPEGPAELHVWQEFCEPVRQKVNVVAGMAPIKLRMHLKPNTGTATGPAPPLPWAVVIERIEETLVRAVDLAEQQQPEALEQARELCLDAYYVHFEAGGLEIAVGRYVSWRRKYALESRFRDLRAHLTQLSQGGLTRADLDRALSELLAELNADADTLIEKGIRDKAALAHSQTHGGASAYSPSGELLVSDAEVHRVLQALHGEFAEVAALMRAGRHREAAARLGDAYFEQFHQIEPRLLAQNFNETTRIESEFTRLRGLAAQGRSNDVRDGLLALYQRIEHAARPAQLWTMALNALIIVLREGVEAILIVTALITFLVKTDRRQHLPAVYWGVAVALGMSVITWAALQGFIASAGFAQEMIEGVVALVAAAVLFYVSYWLISKAEAQRWQRYLTERLQQGTATGSGWALGATAFLAVYREGAETILMFQPIAASGPQGWTVIAAALVGGGVLLAGIFWLFRYAGMRLPLRPFFQCTGTLLMLLAVVFVGKGTAELQEAGVAPITPIPAVPLIAALGIYPTLETLLGQGLLVIVSIVGLWIMSLMRGASQGAAGSTAELRSRQQLAADGERAAPRGSATQREGITT